MDLGAAQMLVAITAGVISAFTAALALGWKVRGWIAEINDTRVTSMASLETRLCMLMATHEDRDQERHDENIKSFGNINERLARMGNGSRPA